MSEPASHIAVVVNLPDSRIAEILSTAWEGGSNYWATGDGTPYASAPDYQLTLSLPVTVYEHDDDVADPIPHILDRAAIAQGLALLPTFPRVLARILAEQDDAGDGDLFLQLCVLGEERYA
jgi:hypothetical protein